MDKLRKEIMVALHRAWHGVFDWRLGQLVFNVYREIPHAGSFIDTEYHQRINRDPFPTTDEQVLEAIRKRSWAIYPSTGYPSSVDTEHMRLMRIFGEVIPPMDHFKGLDDEAKSKFYANRRHPNRITPILCLLYRAWEAHPEKNLFQLLTMAAHTHTESIFYPEEQEWSQWLQGLIAPCHASDVWTDAVFHYNDWFVL